MTDAPDQTVLPQIITPVCPACREPMLELMWNVTGPHQIRPAMPALLAVVMCPLCHAALSANFLPVGPAPNHRPPVIIPGQKFRPGS